MFPTIIRAATLVEHTLSVLRHFVVSVPGRVAAILIVLVLPGIRSCSLTNSLDGVCGHRHSIVRSFLLFRLGGNPAPTTRHCPHPTLTRVPPPHAERAHAPSGRTSLLCCYFLPRVGGDGVHQRTRADGHSTMVIWRW